MLDLIGNEKKYAEAAAICGEKNLLSVKLRRKRSSRQFAESERGCSLSVVPAVAGAVPPSLVVHLCRIS